MILPPLVFPDVTLSINDKQHNGIQQNNNLILC
jgi:hypothetical protein